MKRLRIVFLVACISLLSASILFAAEEKGLIQKIKRKFFKPAPASASVAAKASDKASAKAAPAIHVEAVRSAPAVDIEKMTKEDFVKDIKEGLTEEGILEFIPELKAEKDKDGNISYTYEGVKIENLDKEKLKNLFIRVNRERVRIRTDRITRQMETVRMVNRIARQQKIAHAPAMISVPKAPPAYSAPTPTKAPQVPKMPQLPAKPQR